MTPDTAPLILIDSDAFYALSDKTDSNHKKAVRILREITASHKQPFTNHWVISEVATVLSRRNSQKDASTFVTEMIKRSVMPIVTIDIDVLYQAYDTFLSVMRKNTSMVDCINIAILKSYKLGEIFSFDEVYKKEGFKRIGIDN